jgi:hypothetical protein
MAAPERADGWFEAEIWVQLEPLNTQVPSSLRLLSPTIPNSTTSLSSVPIVALLRPGGRFDTRT